MPEFSEAQLEILRELPGFSWNYGEPCTCGVDHIRTRREYGYSDFLTFHFRCRECGAKFSSFIEG